MTIHLGGAMRRSKSPYGCGGWTGGWVGGELRIFLEKPPKTRQLVPLRKRLSAQIQET